MNKDKRTGICAKMEYLWMYYKLLFTAGAVILAGVVQWVWTAEKGKECVLSVMYTDCHSGTREEELCRDFEEYAKINREAQEISINTTGLLSDASSDTYFVTSLLKFYADTGTESLDIVGFLENNFEKYANTDCFYSLENCFSESELEQYQEYLYYKDGLPIGIYAEGVPGLQKRGIYDNSEKRAVIGIMYNSKHLPMVQKYMKYLMQRV